MAGQDHELHPQCALAHEEFSALLDDELAPGARAEVDAHLAECAPCLRALDAMKKVTDQYATLPRVGAPEDFEAHVRRAVKPGLLRFPKWSSQRWAALAAAAGVTLIAGMYLLLEAEQRAARPQLAKQAEIRNAAGKGIAIEKADSVAVEEMEQDAVATDADATTQPAPALSAMSAQGLSDASEPADDARVRWEAAGRTLFLSGEAWVETGGAGVNTVELVKDSREFQALVEQFPELMELTAAQIPVVFQTGDGKWYRLLPKKN